MINWVKTIACATAGIAGIAATVVLYKKLRQKPVVEVISNEDIEYLISESIILDSLGIEEAVELIDDYYISQGIHIPLYAIKEAAIDRFEECTGVSIIDHLGEEYCVNSWLSNKNYNFK